MKRITLQKGKKLPPKVMDKESKQIQSGRGAKGNKNKLLPRVTKKKARFKVGRFSNGVGVGY